MAEKRKLLQEVDKTYKKVDEGIEIFEEIMTKMYEANSENQRDKFQDDLKREIKKLQRLRDAIKGWQFVSDIKDKDKLTTYRRLIETKMEQFKDIERENKTKPHSKQGLSAEEKLDPREKEKSEAIEWLKNKIRQIQDDIDKTEAKVETVISAGTGRKKRGKDDSKDKIEEMKKHIESLTYHITNLEVCMRLVTNDQKDPKEVMEVLQDALDSYIDALDPDNNMDPKELDPFGLYEELDIEEYIPQLAGVVTTSIDDERDENNGTRSSNHSPFPEERPRNLSTEKPPAIVSTKLSTHQTPSEERTSISSPPPVATPPLSIPYNTVAAGFHIKSPAAHVTAVPAPVEILNSPVPPSSSSRSNASGVYEELETEEYVPQVASVVTTSIDDKKDENNGTRSSNHSQFPEERSRNLSTEKPPAIISTKLSTYQIPSEEKTPISSPLPVSTPPPSIPFKNPKSPAVASVSTPVEVLSSPVLPPPSSSRSNESQSSMTQSSNISTVAPPSSDDLILRELATLNSDGNSDNNRSSDIPSWLGVSPLGRRELSPEEQVHIKRLEDAHRTMPHRFDSEPQRPQMPRMPYQGYSSYPHVQQPLYQTLDYYMRLSPETLLFIFYYMEGSKAQLLAAQALKKLSWRFHTKYLMWFQRHEEPKVITDDYEQGSYIYWDVEKNTQRKKEAFMFEYRYLEDRDLATLL